MTQTELEPDTDQTGTGQEPAKPIRRVYPLAQWLKVRNLYITGHGSLSELALKHGMSEATVQTKALDEKWTTKRKAWMDREQARLEPRPEPATSPEPATVETDSLQERVRIIQTRIQEGETALGQAENGKEFQSIATGLTHLYGIWALLTGHEKPGIRKTKPAKSRSGTVPVPEPE